MTVSGPVTGGEIALRAGQRLLVDLPQGETMISEPKPERGRRAGRGRAGGTTRGATVGGVRQACRADGQARRDSPAGKLDGERRWAGERWPPGISTASSPRPSTPV